MKAAVYSRPGVVEVVDWPEPVPGPGQAKIKIAYAGICGSDIESIHHRFGYQAVGLSWNGEPPVSKEPVPEGHEATGTIVELGPDFKGDWKVGQRVALNFIGSCGVCYYCRTKREHYCEHASWATGVFAEYALFPEGGLYAIPDDVPFELAALVEPLSVALHAVDRTDIVNGQTLAILGGGTIGQLALAVAVNRGAGKILVSEPMAHKREIALRAGADMVVDPLTEDLVAASMKLTDGRGFDGVIDLSGKVKAAEQALDLVDKCGTIVWVSVYPYDAVVPVRPFQMYLKETTIRSAVISPYGFTRTVRLLPKLNVGHLVTNIFPLDKIAEGFANHEKGESIKTLIKM